MKRKTVWNFEYKGINCEIVHWGEDEMASFQPGGIWNGYVFIQKKQLPKQFNKFICKPVTYHKRTHWDYWRMENYFDMHGGVTYYELIRDEITTKPTAIKVGCDYAHLFDEGRTYDENDIKFDLEKTVDKFIEMFPNYLIWRITDGKYVKPNEAKLIK
jgi:hypothetical protein